MALGFVRNDSTWALEIVKDRYFFVYFVYIIGIGKSHSIKTGPYC